jgi:hypothetical protein
MTDKSAFTYWDSEKGQQQITHRSEQHPFSFGSRVARQRCGPRCALLLFGLSGSVAPDRAVPTDAIRAGAPTATARHRRGGHAFRGKGRGPGARHMGERRRRVAHGGPVRRRARPWHYRLLAAPTAGRHDLLPAQLNGILQQLGPSPDHARPGAGRRQPRL